MLAFPKVSPSRLKSQPKFPVLLSALIKSFPELDFLVFFDFTNASFCIAIGNSPLF
jgi:hypothetical protein